MVKSNKEDQVLELKDGRKLGYADYGASQCFTFMDIIRIPKKLITKNNRILDFIFFKPK